MSECTHDCSSCSQNCGSREPQSLIKKPHKNSSIENVIGVVSGKGGVGKSLVTDLLSLTLHRRGNKVGILDADITGPSIPKAFGLTGRAEGNQDGIFPVKTKGGIDVMSINLLLENSTDPVLWRGPIIAGMVTQFWTEVDWGEKDFLVIDMPPGTGDVPLTVYQSIPMTGIVIVATPQDLVSDIVEKAVKMAEMMDVPIIGIIENMSYVKCPDCGKEINIFGKSHVDDIAIQYHIPVLARIPIDPAVTAAVDAGEFETLQVDYVDSAADIIEKLSGK
ncbi:Mrp/NBP35 family ATP-binding protein [Eubacterium xylanophilum]|uniref:Mrp/NBP35 family ATP-binding protein n=1 Tax=Eubacterium xylanophilum TaxID=39497 RepID=UPI00047E9293|nr:Mrp/NBP35 family ATP-binding protein [Eubacterium xylanophilum]